MSGKCAGLQSSDICHTLRRIAQSSPYETGHCPAEIRNVELPERGAVF
jgi:hypothetical protein